MSGTLGCLKCTFELTGVYCTFWTLVVFNFLNIKAMWCESGWKCLVTWFFLGLDVLLTLTFMRICITFAFFLTAVLERRTDMTGWKKGIINWQPVLGWAESHYHCHNIIVPQHCALRTVAAALEVRGETRVRARQAWPIFSNNSCVSWTYRPLAVVNSNKCSSTELLLYWFFRSCWTPVDVRCSSF